MGFTDWDAGLHTQDPNSLEHHGIPGMKWGVRRFQNVDGSLTKKGLARYGANGAGASARAMTKHFNKLDQGYANVVADQRLNQRKTAKYARKGHAAERKGKTEKAKKLIEKSLKYANKAALNGEQKKAIESLQWKIIGKAANKGYTTTSKAVKRIGQDKKARAVGAVSSQFGLVGGLASVPYRAKHSTTVDGQKVKITKRGNGGTSVVNYANANKLAAEERRRERARQMAGVRR